MLEGDLDAAEQAVTEALTLGTAAGYPEARPVSTAAQLMSLRWMQGRLHEMVPRIVQTRARQPRTPRSSAPRSRSRRASTTPHDEVRQLLDTEVTDDFPMFADSTWLGAHVLWAERRRAQWPSTRGDGLA